MHAVPSLPGGPAEPAELPWRLLALPPLDEAALRALVGDAPVELLLPPTRDAAGVRAVLPQAELVLGDWTAQLRLGAPEAALASRLAFVQQPSVGVEHIDLAAFAERGVPVANTAGANAVGVAEWCLAAALAVSRSIPWLDAQVRAGGWPQLEAAERGCSDLAGRPVGIVGFGAIGAACAQRFAAMGCPVSYWSRRRRDPAQEQGAAYRDLDELCASSQVLVVVVALAPQTRGLIDARRIALLPSGAILVDAARGGIVDEEALLDAVRGRRLAGAALDVFATEPLPAGSPLRGEDRILLSPHAAGASWQSRLRILQDTLDNLRRAAAGEPVRSVVNGVDPQVRRRPPG